MSLISPRSKYVLFFLVFTVLIMAGSFTSNSAYAAVGDFISTFDGTVGGTEFDALYRITVDANDKIIVTAADIKPPILQTFNPDGSLFQNIDLGYMMPFAVAVNSTGHIILTNPDNIFILEKDGFLLKIISTAGDVPIESAYGVAVDSNNRIIIVDAKNDVIHVFDSDGEFILTFDGVSIDDVPTNAGGPDSMNLYGVAVDSSDNIIVGDSTNNALHLFDENGYYIKSFTGQGGGGTEFYSPNGVAIDSNDNMLVADSTRGIVQLFNSEGEFIHEILMEPIPLGPSSFIEVWDKPYAVAFDNNDNIIVGDHDLNVVQIFEGFSPEIVVSDVSPPWIVLYLDSYSIELGGFYEIFIFSAFDDTDIFVQDKVVQEITFNGEVVDTVDVYTEGVYYFTFNVEDTAGNPATELTRTVTVTADVTSPTFNVDGHSDHYTTDIELGGSYTVGTILNIDDASGTDGGVITGTVDTTTENQYIVTYTVTDTASTPNSFTITETVTVVDTTAPTFNVDGNIEDFTTQIQLGGTYTVGNILNIVDASDTIESITSTVDTTATGDYDVTYTVTDESLTVHSFTIIETVTVTDDVTKPVIIAPADIIVEATAVDTPLVDVNLGTATATDNVDDDDEITITNNAPESFPLGETIITWTATDTATNTSTDTQLITVEDTTKPVITLDRANFSIELGEAYIPFIVTATDNIDLDISILVEVKGNVVINTVGSYVITFDVSDAAGNAADTKTRTVTVVETIVDNTPPHIIVDQASFSILVGEDYDEFTYTVTDNIDHDLHGAVMVDGYDKVDVDVGGKYDITFNVSDLSGNAAETITRVITVMGDETKIIIVDDSKPHFDVASDVSAIKVDFDAYTVDNLVTMPEDFIIVSDITDITIPFTVEFNSLTDNNMLTFEISTITPTDITGITGTIGEIIEFGSPSESILFTHPVRITLPDQAGGNPFYVNLENEGILITTVCDDDTFATVDGQLVDGGIQECSINVDGDLVIWTRHFTAYASSTGSSTGAPISADTISPSPVSPINNGGEYALETPSGIATVKIGDSTYALVTSSIDHTVQIIDISAPDNPIATYTFSDDNNFRGGPLGIATVKVGDSTYALVANSLGNTVDIIDISNPDNSSIIYTISDGGGYSLDGPLGIATVKVGDSTYALVSNYIDDSVQIIDISTPSLPTAKYTISDGGGYSLDGPLGIATVKIGDSTYALVTSYIDDSVQIIDISTPSLPTVVTSITDGFVGAGAIWSDYGGPTDVSIVEIDGFVYAVVSDYVDDTVVIINISDPYKPTLVSSITDSYLGDNRYKYEIDYFSGPTGIATVKVGDSTYALVTSSLSNAVHIIDISSPDDLSTVISLLDGGGYALSGVNDLTIVEIDGFVYTVVVAKRDNSIQLIKLAAVDDSSDAPTKKKSGGDSNPHLSRPTFGLSHETHNSLVDNGFRFNYNSFDITDNWHTPFDAQNVTIGERNSFSAKVFTVSNLMVQEFLFGIPEVGEGHKAELGVEVWYNFDGDIIDTKLIQKTKVVDPDTLLVLHEKVKCQESDDDERCDLTIISMIFLEPLKDDIMAIKAIDQKRKTHTTYLNDGFDISGYSLNPMKTMMIAGPEKYEGLIEIMQTHKYSNIWFSDDNRLFEQNDYGAFTHINKSYERHLDTGDPKNRLHSEFVKKIQYEAERANAMLDDLCPHCNDESYDKINNIFAYEIPEIFESKYDNPVIQKLLILEEERAKKYTK